MSIIGESVDLIKASKQWKDEYEKKHDTELYIFRITDLNSKLCIENKNLKKKINEMENPEFTLNNCHLEILKKIYESEAEAIIEEEVSELINDINFDLAFQELIDEGYIHKQINMYGMPFYSLSISLRAEAIRGLVNYKHSI